MPTWPTESYWLVRFLFQRALAVVYLSAFLVAATQFRPLAGEDGLRPLSAFVGNRSFRDAPSLFHLVPDDRAVAVASWTGVGLSLLALVAAPYRLPAEYAVPGSMLLWAAMWALYQSFVNAGGVFYGYGWESMLLETGFLAVFLGAGPTGPPAVVMWLLSWVLFRNMFGAGLIKMRGDDCWRDLTAMDSHYETQPMPNPLSRFAHHLPERFHRVEVLGNHVVELAVPFLYFAPQPYAAVGGALTVGFQGWLMLTGNFAWLNALTIVQAVSTFSDGVLASVLPVSAPAAAPAPLYQQGLAVVVAVVVLALSVRPVRNVLSESQVMNRGYDPLHIVNTYGAFGSITRTRYQLVVEGTDDPDPDEDDWEEYAFEGQPVDVGERPPQWAPYHLRLDWQLWFAAMRPRPGRRQRWLFRFLDGLLAGDDDTVGLVADAPFPEGPSASASCGIATASPPRRRRRRRATGGCANAWAPTSPPLPGGTWAARRRRDYRGALTVERFVAFVVAGGVALVAGLWATALWPTGTVPWGGGVALALAGVAALGWGISRELDV